MSPQVREFKNLVKTDNNFPICVNEEIKNLDMGIIENQKIVIGENSPVTPIHL